MPVSLRYVSRAAAHSEVAETCGTPIPRTSREVQAAPGPTPTKQGGDARPHQFERRIVAAAVADNYRYLHLLAQLGENKSLGTLGDVGGGRDCGLHDKDVHARFKGDGDQSFGVRRGD